MSKLLYQKPRCIRRLGKQLFIKLPLYKANNLYDPIYINEQLFQKCFGGELSFNEQSELIKSIFSVTLQTIKSTGQQCGYAYVDRQAEDMYGVSLIGNQGSGRAYYTGSCFNIKGEKTPLATSANYLLSNGLLSLGHGIWSALIGNSLYDELHVSPSPVLAILRVDQDNCKIIRIDNGTLDRITHLLYQQTTLCSQQLKSAAKHLGWLEAEKIIHRILHGAWSAGNSSLKGHLIDYDSVCAVKGRQPQYNFTPNFPDNYFGFESLGQLKVLENIACLHYKFNQNNEQCASLTNKKTNANPAHEIQCFENSFHKHLSQGLIYLMGFHDYQRLEKKFTDYIKPLTQSFLELSHFTYYVSSQSLFANFPESLFFHLYDLSAFFRVYPLLRLTRSWKPERGIDIMMRSSIQKVMMKNEKPTAPLIPAVYEKFKRHLLSCDKKPKEDRAVTFINMYEELFTKLLTYSKSQLHEIAARAYVINEDRLYLLPVFSVEKLLTYNQNNYSPYDLHRYISLFIQASKRTPILHENTTYSADMRIFKEGYLHTLLSRNTYQIAIHLYKDKLKTTKTVDKKWQIQVHEQSFQAQCSEDEKMLHIISQPIKNTYLLQNYNRDAVFLLNQYVLHCDDVKIHLTDLFYPGEESGYYL